jgi:hypothetical protein
MCVVHTLCVPLQSERLYMNIFFLARSLLLNLKQRASIIVVFCVREIMHAARI